MFATLDLAFRAVRAVTSLGLEPQCEAYSFGIDGVQAMIEVLFMDTLVLLGRSFLSRPFGRDRSDGKRVSRVRMQPERAR
jgi:hypothetical protein